MSSQRQLAAILFSDIVGYTALMGEDEKKAFAVLAKNRELQKTVIEQFSGRWIKELGDGVLASFATVSDAVSAAKEIQEQCHKTGLFSLRIGIHQGEIVFEDGDVFGDAVNIASRIQAIAPSGGILVSESIYQNLINKKEIQTSFIGEKNLKNVKQPVRIYEVLCAAGPLEKKSLTPSAVYSIAVLPFVNMSNDPEQEYFCDGISEEIINALTQLNHIRVIARTSAFAFKAKNIDVREIGKLLDVATLLEGSVRKAGNQLRITTQLVRASDGSHAWSARYDRVLEDVFSIQDDIAEKVATALKGVLTVAEKQAIRRPETTIDAYEYYLKGRELHHSLSLAEAKTMFEKSIALDPEYAPAFAGLSYVHSWLYEWCGGKQADMEAAEKYSARALSLAPSLPESHSARGFVLSLASKYPDAEVAFQKAIEMNPNSFEAWYFYGRSAFASGQIEKSAELFRKAAEVRREDFQSMLLLAQSLQILGKDHSEELKEGIKRARKQLEINPTDCRALSLTPGSMIDNGEREEAMLWIDKALSLYPEDSSVVMNAICLFAKVGNKEKALSLLQTAAEKGFGKKDWIENDPDYDSLRDEPRFQELMSRFK